MAEPVDTTDSWKERVTVMKNAASQPLDDNDQWVTTFAKHYMKAVERGEARPPHIDMEIATNIVKFDNDLL